MRIVVCQRGARMRYAVSRIFYDSGMLGGLYTDSTAWSPLGRLGTVIAKFTGNRQLAKLSKRIPAGVPRTAVFSSDRLFWQRLLHRPLSMESVYRRWGVARCDAVYSFYGEDIGFLEYAATQGKKLIVDIMSHPFYQRILAEEAEKYPFFQIDPAFYRKRYEEHHRKTLRILRLADLIICPSEWVESGVKACCPGCAGKIRRIAYGNSIDFGGRTNQPQARRLLFVGHGSLGKGIHHLAMVYPEIKKRFPDLSVRIVGASYQECKNIPHIEQFEFTGSLPLDQVKNEYLTADIFVMPSISEGQCGAAIEALSSGIPVVLTRQSGIDLKHGEEGLLYDAGDLDALRDNVLQLLGNRELRTRIAEGGRKFASVFTYENWRRHLASAILEAWA